MAYSSSSALTGGYVSLEGYAITYPGPQFPQVLTLAPSDVDVFDTDTNTLLTTVKVGSWPMGVAVTPDGTRVYVANNASGPSLNAGTVSVIDTVTNTVISTVQVGVEPVRLAINPAGTRVYVANERSGTISVIDTATNAVVATIPVGTIPVGVAVHPSGTRVYVARLGATSVIDTATNAEVASVPVGTDLGIPDVGDPIVIGVAPPLPPTPTPTPTPVAAKLAFTQQPSATATAGQPFGKQPTVAVQDSSGATVTSDNSTVITLSKDTTSTGTGTLTCTGGLSKIVTSGVAAFTGCAFDQPGTYSVQASSGVLTPAMSTNIVVSPPASTLSVRRVWTTDNTNTPQTTFTAGQEVRYTAEVQNTASTSVSATFDWQATHESGVTVFTLTETQSVGPGTTTWSRGGNLPPTAPRGTYTVRVRVTANGQTSEGTASFSVSNATPVATKLAFTQPLPPSSTTVGQTFGLAVQVQDANDKPVVPSQPVTVTLKATSTTGALGKLTCAGGTGDLAQPTDATGKASFSDCKFDQPGVYTITASATALQQAVSTSVKVHSVQVTDQTLTNEPSLAIDPRNSRHFVIGFNDIAATLGGVYAWAESLDGGQTWPNKGAVHVPAGLPKLASVADPWVRFGPDGKLFYTCMAASNFVPLPDPLRPTKKWAVFLGVSPTGTASALSATAARSVVTTTEWCKQRTPFLTTCEGRAMHGSWFDHPAVGVLAQADGTKRVVVCWTRKHHVANDAGETGGVEAATSADDGATWSRPHVMSGPGGAFCTVGGGAGIIGVAWWRFGADAAAGEIGEFGVRTSTDGRVWSTPAIIARQTESFATDPNGSPTISTTDKVLSGPYALLTAKGTGALRAIYQLRVNGRSQVYVGDSDSSWRAVPMGDVGMETFLPGAGTCPNVVGMYQGRPGATEVFQYTVWSIATDGTASRLFKGEDLDISSALPVTNFSLRRIGDYTGVDCLGKIGGASWTGGAGSHIQFAPIAISP